MIIKENGKSNLIKSNQINFATTEEPIKIHDEYIRSKNITILICYETDEAVEELFAKISMGIRKYTRGK